MLIAQGVYSMPKAAFPSLEFTNTASKSASKNNRFISAKSISVTIFNVKELDFLSFKFVNKKRPLFFGIQKTTV